jgi:phage shock protein PspC (stress-responsive transcriptional regulator)
MNTTEPARTTANERLAKAVFAVLALASVLAGLGIYLLQERLGIDEDTARLIATAFLVVGIGDTLLLYLWDRLFKRSG